MPPNYPGDAEEVGRSILDWAFERQSAELLVQQIVDKLELIKQLCLQFEPTFSTKTTNIESRTWFKPPASFSVIQIPGRNTQTLILTVQNSPVYGSFDIQINQFGQPVPFIVIKELDTSTLFGDNRQFLTRLIEIHKKEQTGSSMLIILPEILEFILLELDIFLKLLVRQTPEQCIPQQDPTQVVRLNPPLRQKPKR